MKRILITGANSFVGESVEAYLKRFHGKYQVDTIDMINGEWRKKSFAGYDSVYHVAGIAHVDTGKISDEQKALYFKVNTDLAIETAQKAKKDGAKQFIYMSSAIVYGDSAPIGKSKIITKDTVVSPANFYGESKVKGEEGILPLNADSFHVVIIRTPMIFGKGSKGNYPTLAKFALKLPLFPYIKNERSMIYVGNLAEFVRLMIENYEAGVFCPQNAEYSNTSEMVKMIASAHGKKTVLVKGFGWALKLLSHFTGLVNKAFGNLTYTKELSKYHTDYCIFSLQESILKTEEHINE